MATYARLAFGNRVSTMVGWAFFLAIPIGAPVAAGFGASYVADAVGRRAHDRGRRDRAGIIVVVAIMNWLGIQVSAGVQLGIAAVIATLLLVAILVSLPRVDTDNLTPFLTHGWSGVGSAAARAGVGVRRVGDRELAVGGVPPPRARHRPRHRDHPGVVTVLYLGIAFVTVAVLGTGAGRAPLADLLAGAFGDWARPLTTVIAVLLTIGAINSYFAGASRLGASLAITGAMPRWLGSDIGDGRATPRHALLVVAGLGLAVTVGGGAARPADRRHPAHHDGDVRPGLRGRHRGRRTTAARWLAARRRRRVVRRLRRPGRPHRPAGADPDRDGVAGLCWTLFSARAERRAWRCQDPAEPASSRRARQATGDIPGIARQPRTIGGCTTVAGPRR